MLQEKVNSLSKGSKTTSKPQVKQNLLNRRWCEIAQVPSQKYLRLFHRRPAVALPVQHGELLTCEQVETALRFQLLLKPPSGIALNTFYASLTLPANS